MDLASFEAKERWRKEPSNTVNLLHQPKPFYDPARE